MAGKIELYTRGAVKLYEEDKGQLPAGKVGIDNVLFPMADSSLESDVRLDQYIEQPYAIAYRDKDNQSHLRAYEAGSGEIYSVPRASEKTAVGEDLKDSLTAGMEGNSRHAVNFQNILRRIVNSHVTAHHVTKWKQAIDVMRDGVFYARGLGAGDIGLDIDFQRDPANTLTVNFNGTSMTKALIDMHKVLDAAGASKQNRVVLMGDSWLRQWSNDTKITKFMEANAANILLTQQMMTEELNQAHGLFVMAQYRAQNHPAAAWICEFNPTTAYISHKGATAAPFVPDNEAIMFVLGEQRWKVLRGVDVLSGAGKSGRQNGDVVFDAYSENDPVTDFIRSQSRHLFLPGNINHTVKSTGENFS